MACHLGCGFRLCTHLNSLETDLRLKLSRVSVSHLCSGCIVGTWGEGNRNKNRKATGLDIVFRPFPWGGRRMPASLTAPSFNDQALPLPPASVDCSEKSALQTGACGESTDPSALLPPQPPDTTPPHPPNSLVRGPAFPFRPRPLDKGSAL